MKIKLFAIIACLLWGSAFAAAKIAMEYTSPIHLSGMRFTLAGLLLIPIILYNKINWRKDLREWKYMLVFGFLQTFVQYGLFFIGLNATPATIAAIIVGCGPLFVALLAHFFMPDEPLTWRKTSAIALGILGVIFITFANTTISIPSRLFWFGVSMLILSNINGAFTNIIVAKNKGRVSPYTLTAFANISGGLLLFILSYFIETPRYAGYTPQFYLALVWLAIIPAAGFSIWYTLLHKPQVKVSELNMWKFVIPVSGVILSWLLLPNEYPNIYSIGGVLIITIALFLIQPGSGIRRRK